MSTPPLDLKRASSASSPAHDKLDQRPDAASKSGTGAHACGSPSKAGSSHANVGSVASLVSMHAEEHPARGSGAMQSYASSLFKEGTVDESDLAAGAASGGLDNTVTPFASGGCSSESGKVCCLLCILHGQPVPSHEVQL